MCQGEADNKLIKAVVLIIRISAVCDIRGGVRKSLTE